MSTVYTQPISTLKGIVSAQKQGQAIGIPSICSAHPYVIEASLRHALAGDASVLIESVSNQVNQFGGYTGMTPADFVAFVHGIAERVGFPRQRIILGGDHLGPNPWSGEPGGRWTKSGAGARLRTGWLRENPPVRFSGLKIARQQD